MHVSVLLQTQACACVAANHIYSLGGKKTEKYHKGIAASASTRTLTGARNLVQHHRGVRREVRGRRRHPLQLGRHIVSRVHRRPRHVITPGGDH